MLVSLGAVPQNVKGGRVDGQTRPIDLLRVFLKAHNVRIDEL